MTYIPPTTNLGVTQIAAAYSVLPTDQYIEATVTTANYAVTLPATTGSGRVIYITKIGATNQITITPTGTDTIDGSATLVVKTNYTSYTLIDVVVGRWEII